MVLIVEDDADIRRELQLLVEQAGYPVRVASDGVEGLAELLQRRPCLVLLDLMMPRMTGWQLFEKMQDDPVMATVPVCFMTAVPGKAPRGGVAVIPKPIAPDELLALVTRHCRHAQPE